MYTLTTISPKTATICRKFTNINDACVEAQAVFCSIVNLDKISNKLQMILKRRHLVIPTPVENPQNPPWGNLRKLTFVTDALHSLIICGQVA